MNAVDILKQIPDMLLPWYENNRRQLPWRADQEPYHVWISEIMLQQTRVEAVKGYYSRFLERITNVEALANADDDLLHKLWEGLGYYSRVRNMKKAAQVIMQAHNGKFPAAYDEILALPGIGEYTAGAICSIAYNMKIPAVDGNVLRVVSRLTNDPAPIDVPATKKNVKSILAEIYPEEAGNFTQSLMELGATVCSPNGAPDCQNCPCKAICLGYQNHTERSLPVKSAKRPRRQEQMTLFVLRCENRYALQKRPKKGLLAGLWEFPNVQGHLSVEDAIGVVESNGAKPKEILCQVEKKHIFTHVEWNMRGVYMEVGSMPDSYTWLTADEVESFAALPTAFRQFWEEINHV